MLDKCTPLKRERQCPGHVTCGGRRREGCLVNVYRRNGQHILARVDSPPYLPVRVTAAPPGPQHTQAGIPLEQAEQT